MPGNIKIMLRENDGTEETVETTYDIVAEAGVIERNGKFYTFQQMRGQFFTTPVFQHVKKVEF